MFERDLVLPLNQIEIAERVTRGRDAALIVGLRVKIQSGLQIIQRLIGMSLLEQTAAGGECRRLDLLEAERVRRKSAHQPAVSATGA